MQQHGQLLILQSWIIIDNDSPLNTVYHRMQHRMDLYLPLSIYLLWVLKPT